MKITGQVLGLKELEKQLQKVAGATQGKVLRGALRKAAKPVHTDMQANLNANFNSQTGHLSESIKTKTALNKKGNHSIYDAAAYVGVYPNKKAQGLTGSALPAPLIAYWLETGVKPHILNPKELANLIAQMLQQGVQPEEIVAQLVEKGMPEDQAKKLREKLNLQENT